MPPMLDQLLSEKLDAAWGDPQTWQANGLQWTHLPAIKAMMYRRVSGDPGLSLMRWFARQVARTRSLPLGRVLVLGCGAGDAERNLLEHGIAREIVAFDLSTKVLEEARARAAPGAPVTWVQADMNHLPVGEAPFLPGTFDAVVGESCVHHCENLEGLYDAVNRLLVPGGWFFMDEYIGPDRFQYPPALIRQINALSDLLPDRLLTTHSGQVRRGFRAPTVEEVVAVDPSEAICATRIIPALAGRFHIEQQRPYGGALLHLLLADVAQNFMDDQGQQWLHSLMETEEEAYRMGTLDHHFACVIARSKGPGVPTMERSAATNS